MQIIYLAAGSSRRFLSQKLLYEFRGRPLYMHGLDALKQLAEMRNDCRIRVVYREEQIALDNPDIETVYSPDSSLGISYSIRAGLEGVNDDVMFAAADQPGITADTLNGFIDAFYSSDKPCGCLAHKGIPGNPAIFRSELLEELQGLQKDTGGRAVLKKYPCFLYETENAAELYDIDTLKDAEFYDNDIV
ncbi:MAG: nucleotidyltransferase family protein [Parasporobacterium sp.]|nr:nucleotidyltransferase family protein [Parasporobacterium sp.]